MAGFVLSFLVAVVVGCVFGDSSCNLLGDGSGTDHKAKCDAIRNFASCKDQYDKLDKSAITDKVQRRLSNGMSDFRVWCEIDARKIVQEILENRAEPSTPAGYNDSVTIDDCLYVFTNLNSHDDDDGHRLSCEAMQPYFECLFRVSSPESTTTKLDYILLKVSLSREMANHGLECLLDVEELIKKKDENWESEKSEHGQTYTTAKEKVDVRLTATENQTLARNSKESKLELATAITMAVEFELATSYEDCQKVYASYLRDESCYGARPYLKCITRVNLHQIIKSEHIDDLLGDFFITSLGIDKFRCFHNATKIWRDVEAEEKERKHLTEKFRTTYQIIIPRATPRNSSYTSFVNAVTLDACSNALASTSAHRGIVNCELVNKYAKCAARVQNLSRKSSGRDKEKFKKSIHNLGKKLGLDCSVELNKFIKKTWRKNQTRSRSQRCKRCNPQTKI